MIPVQDPPDIGRSRLWLSPDGPIGQTIDLVGLITYEF